MNQKKPFDGAVENHHLHLLVGFECGDDLVHLRKHLRTEDVERWVVKRDSPILGRALGHTYLSILGCCEIVILHVGFLLISWFSSALSSRGFGEVVPHKETPATNRRGAL